MLSSVGDDLLVYQSTVQVYDVYQTHVTWRVDGGVDDTPSQTY